MSIKKLAGILACGWIAICMASAVQAAGCGCGGMSNQSYKSLCGPACYSPPGCTLSPGCCECPPTACDNAWEGYCQHKAKWQAYFKTVGTPRPSYYSGNRGCYGMPTRAAREVSADCVLTPDAAAPAVVPEPAKQTLPPAPAPEKTTRSKVLYPWMR
jgi:hypothetical protein